MSKSSDISANTSREPDDSDRHDGRGAERVADELAKFGNEDASSDALSDLQTEHEELKKKFSALKTIVGISWLVFFNVFAFQAIGVASGIVIGILELIIILIYMHVTGDEFLLRIWQDFKSYLGQGNTEDGAKSKVDKPPEKDE